MAGNGSKMAKSLGRRKKVEIEIKIRYPSGSESKRPDKFIINSITTDEFGNKKLSKYDFQRNKHENFLY